MVFQSYALFPHMSVFENVAYGLRVQRLSKSEIQSRVADVLAKMSLSHLAQRAPNQLSGGQTFRKISLPLIRGAFLTGLMFAFARSMTTLSPIIFITTPDTPILTSLILAEADTVRYGYAFAFCTLLIAIVLVTMGLINLIVRKTQGTGYRPITVSAG